MLQGANIVGHQHSFKLVTKEWIEACILQGKWVSEDSFMPEIVKNNQSLSSEDVAKYRRQQYAVKRGLFKNMTFTIKEDDYPDVPEDEGQMIITSFGEFASKEEIIEHMHRQIIENGGKIVPASSKHSSHFIIIEDGVNNKIWEMLG
jgi:hypothetical protein